MPHLPLTIIAIVLVVLFPFLSRKRRNALILLGALILPIGGLYLYCKFFGVTQFITSRYFINFLPIFLITLFLSLDTIQLKIGEFRKRVRLNLLS